MKSLSKSLGALLLLMCAAAVAEPALTARQAELQAQPQADAATVATLPENTKVDIVSRRGAWSQVKTSAGQSGWVRMLNLKLEGGQAASGSNPAAGLGSLLSAGRTSSSATVTTGVKGFSKEDIQNAQANPAELAKLKGYVVSKDAGETFAKRSKLNRQKLEYLSEPAANRTESTSLQGG